MHRPAAILKKLFAAASCVALVATTGAGALPITPGGTHSGHQTFRLHGSPTKLSKHKTKRLITEKFFHHAPFTGSPHKIHCNRRSRTKVHCRLHWKTNWNQGGTWEYNGQAGARLYPRSSRVRLHWHYHSHRIT